MYNKIHMTSFYRGWKSSSTPPLLRRPRREGASRPRKFFAFIGYLLGRFFRIKGILKKLIVAGLFAGIVGFILFGSVFAYYSFQVPDPNKLIERETIESTKILDRNGKQLYELYDEEKRDLINLSEIPEHVKEATVAIEDKNFYTHKGISITGIIRSVIVNILTASKSQGGSTITQQFVRNSVLTLEKSWRRKIKEIALSLQIERKYSKDEILQLYLNEIPYGSNAYGVEAAAQTFFGKSVREVSLVEAAYLAALPQAPSYYSPFGPNRETLDGRADTVLAAMAQQGYITEEEKETAQKQQVEFRQLGRGILAPHFVLYIQDLLAKTYGDISLRRDGLKVTTTLDLDLQQKAEEIVARHVADAENKYNATNASLVAIDPRTGQILAMVGSHDYFDEDHDGAVNIALRPLQPGSSFKPYVYATAFKEGMSPATMLMDVTTNFGDFGGKEYIPGNYDGKNYGPLSIRKALQGSLNIPAVKTLILTGIEDSIATAESMGITTLKDRSRFGPSIVLGGAEVKLLEHTAAYGVFAAGGVKHDTVSILKIEDKEGEILEEYKESQGREVLDPQIAYQITHVLSDNDSRVYIFGRNNRLQLPGRPVAAKTGTTQEYRDAWTMGYTPSLTAGVWMGNNDHSAMKGGASGSLVAAAIWQEFMIKAHEGKPVEQFTRPEGITEIAVDSVSGKLPTAHTPETKTEIFASFNIPAEYDDVHIVANINGVLQPFTVLRSEQPDNPSWEDPVRFWALANGYFYPPDGSTTEQPRTDNTISINIKTPPAVTAVPWGFSAEVAASLQINEVRFLLNGRLLGADSSAPYEYTGSENHVDGNHQITVQVQTAGNRTSQKIGAINFALGKPLLLLEPLDNQVLNFPANVTLEAKDDMGADAVEFYRRSAAGIETKLSGTVSKKRFSGIYHYTLNWAASEKPGAGSYSIYTKTPGGKSNEVTIKIP